MGDRLAEAWAYYGSPDKAVATLLMADGTKRGVKLRRADCTRGFVLFERRPYDEMHWIDAPVEIDPDNVVEVNMWGTSHYPIVQCGYKGIQQTRSE